MRRAGAQGDARHSLLCFLLALVLFAASRTVRPDMEKLSAWLNTSSE